MKTLKLYLASRSPRRLELLRALGFEPVTLDPGCDESARPGESPEQMVARLARAKADAVLEHLPKGEPGLVIAADTTVTIDGDVLGKPHGAAEALAMLRRLEGREHCVATGLVVARTDTEQSVLAVETTRVRFRQLPASVLSAYVATGEPLDKAGAYGIQGRGALFVESLDGSWSNVVGLPLERLAESLERAGADLDELLAGRLVLRAAPATPSGQEPTSC